MSTTAIQVCPRMRESIRFARNISCTMDQGSSSSSRRRASLDEAIAALSAGLEATGRARTHEALARMDWDRMYKRNYGALVERFGKKNAERYFLHNAVRAVADDAADEEPAVVPDEQ